MYATATAMKSVFSGASMYVEVLQGVSSGYQVRDKINIRRGLARIAHDQAEHLIILTILFQDGLERRRITRLVIFGIEFISMLPVFGFDFSLF
jgi:hypothetical protein